MATSSNIIFGDTDVRPNDMAGVSGTGANDKLQSGHADGSAYKDYQQFYGGEGSDTFILRAKDFGGEQKYGVDKYITDFQGAGGWFASNNDFLALTGFGSGSTLTYEKSGAIDSGSLDYYTIHDTATNANYTLMIHSLNGEKLKAGDYAFYA
jgi:hypothetical protein